MESIFSTCENKGLGGTPSPKNSTICSCCTKPSVLNKFDQVFMGFEGQIKHLYGAIESVTDPQDVRDPSGESVRVKVDKGISFVILGVTKQIRDR